MDTKTSTQIILGVFFLFFILISGDCVTLMNCDVQKYIKGSVLIKHGMVVLMIFLFSFILDWYSYDSITVSTRVDGRGGSKGGAPNKLNGPSIHDDYIKESVKRTAGMYGFFLLTCKSEGLAVSVFLLTLVYAIFAIIYIKFEYDEEVNLMNNKSIMCSTDIDLVVKEHDLSVRDRDRLVELSRITGSYHGILCGGVGVICVGAYLYTSRQYTAHKSNWSTLRFIFGNGCKV